MSAGLIVIPKRGSVSFEVPSGQMFSVINTHGSQVVDTWAFNADDPNEFMSMEHSRVSMGTVRLSKGCTLVTNKRRPILSVIDDTSPGVHDTLIAACDRYRYELLGCDHYHDNCTDNLARALSEGGVDSRVTPCPLNLFQNTKVDETGAIFFLPPLSRPGDKISLRAEQRVVVVCSACPQDILPINGQACSPTEAHVQLT